MKPKTKLIIKISVVTALLAMAYSVFASLNGSMIKKFVITSKVKDYVAKTYIGQPFEVEFCQYNFKTMSYYCYVQSTASEDTHFTVWEDEDAMADDYERSVTGRENTLFRLSVSLSEYVEQLFRSIYPHPTSNVFCDTSENVSEKEIAQLTLDMPFDVKNFPLSTTLMVWVETSNEKPTWEELGIRFRELEELTRDELPCVEYYSIWLQDKYVEKDGELQPANYNSKVCAYNVPREVIIGNNLEDYLSKVKAALEVDF